MLEGYVVLTRTESDGPWGSQFKDLGTDQGKIYDHVVIIIHSEFYLGDTLTGSHAKGRPSYHGNFQTQHRRGKGLGSY